MLNSICTLATMIEIFISFLFLPFIVSSGRLLDRLYLPSSLTGPQSLAFNSIGEGPYTGVSDGRILKYVKENDTFYEFAHVSPDRDKTMCDGISDFSTSQLECGRPLGLSFDYKTGDLYVADAYFGLVKVAYDGGTATQLVAGFEEGSTFGFLAGLDIDPQTGIVYFTEASSGFKFGDLQELLNSTDSSGSLFRYDPTTGETTLLYNNLAVAAGVAVSSNGSFVLVCEYMANRILRFWLTEPKENTAEIFLQLPGRPDNIKRNSNNEFWVAVNYPFGSPPPPRPPVLPLGLRVNEEGFVLQAVPLVDEFGTDSVSEIQETEGKLYATSLYDSYINVFMP